MTGLREGRFFYTKPIVTQGDFYKSRFLVCYDQTERCPQKETVIDALEDLSSIADCHDVISKINSIDDEYDIIQTYTSEVKLGSQTFYTYMNQRLCADNEQILRHFMPLIGRATSQINYHGPSTACIAYRGMHLNDQQRAYFKIGTIFRFPGFTSTSKSRALAQDRGNTLFEIHIYAGCLQVRDVSDVSEYPDEQEYLFSPYSLFEVKNVNGQTITIHAIDNKSSVGIISQSSDDCAIM